MELYLRKHNQMQAAKCSADVRGDRVRSKWAAASCVLTLRRDAWAPALEGYFFLKWQWDKRTRSSFLSEIQTTLHLRDYSLPEPQASPS